MDRNYKVINIAVITVVLFYAAITSISFSVSGGLDHDEHQFMASAFMVAKYGLHPYQDFAYFHMPNLVYIYAPFFFTPYPLLLARIFVGICGFGICATLFFYTRYLFSGYSRFASITIPICITILFLHCSLYKFAVSHVWNHTPSTFFALLGFLIHCHALRSSNPIKFYFFSGACLGMALGIRLSFAPLIIPFLITIFYFQEGSFKQKCTYVLAFGVGGLLSNMLAIFFFFTSFHDFWFGNLSYAQLNTLYREEMAFTRTMTLFGKFKNLIQSFIKIPTNLLVTLSCFYSLALFRFNRSKNSDLPKFQLLFVSLCLPFVFFGSLAPTPIWYQYYFALVPFLMLLIIFTLSDSQSGKLSIINILPFVFFVIISFSIIPLKSNFSIAKVILSPMSLPPLSIQMESEELRNLINPKKQNRNIISLSPLFAVSSKLPIDERFVTGPFAWRVSHLLSDEEANIRGLPIRSKIKRYVEAKRPSAIITGREEELEIPLNNAARELGFQQIITSTGITIWLNIE